jgi:hypothetical protein
VVDPTPPDLESVWLAAVTAELLRAVRLSSHWRRMRHAIRSALDLDPAYLRHLRILAGTPIVTNHSYNTYLPYREHLLRVARETPHLLWLLYQFVHRLGVTPGVTTDPVAALKALFRDHGVRAAGWRYLVQSQASHFTSLLEGKPDRHWTALCHWLKVMQFIRRQSPVPAEVVKLLAPTLSITDSGLELQGILVQAGVVRALLQETEQQVLAGTLQAFLDTEWVNVLTWLKAATPHLDANQTRGGWDYLARRAMDWCREQEAGALAQTRWSSLLPVTDSDGYRLVPLTDAYQLWREGVAMRHCIGNTDFAESCDLNELRVFSVQHADRRVATLTIRRTDGGWVGGQTLGFANSVVGDDLVDLEQVIAERYNDLAKVLEPETVAGESAEEFADDADGDDQDDEDSSDRACPFCHTVGDDCEHVVAHYDLTFGELEGGALYDAYQEIHTAIEQGIWHAIRTGDWQFGVTDAVYRIPNDVASDAGVENIQTLIMNCYGEIKAMIFDRLENYAPEVVTTEWEFDAQRPGGCSWYKGYWANDPDAVVDWLKAEFGVEEAVNPMRPAVEAYEAAALRCGR